MSKASRRESRERLRQERLKQQQRAKRNKLLAIIGAAVVVVALVVGVGYLVMSSRGQSSEWDGALAPRTLQQDGSVVMATEGAQAPVVEVYADYQCPACRQFEAVNGDNLKQLAAEGKAIVHYRPVSIFSQRPDPISTNSLRGAAAARAAADHGAFVEYNDLLFENQPTEGREGFSVDELKEWGEEAGITDPAFAERIDSESAIVDQWVNDYYPALVEKAQAEMSDEEISGMRLHELMEWGRGNGVDDSFLDGTYVGEVLDATAAVNDRYSSGENAFQGTPSVYINGQLQGNDIYTVDGLTDAVEAASPGQVDTEPLADGDSPTTNPSDPPTAKETTDE
ncbi:DsbA family protein [Marinactinospora thermotolerans]|uniref:Protein-disulfide isomerase n=1 Tax=Marinactinospora thermotolerans DSM 45154 TaxID=1122192 RepID=A0A1T4KRN7_9ACTN|nr:thioredoxin domain-containing protein [Marinactinospora thermotolerans]SJZ45076.1 Protein-disulfide isomerase [Marinactinospora thermotolerans DSM 45154]